MQFELLAEEGGSYRSPRTLTVERLQPNQFKVIGRVAGEVRIVVTLHEDS
jgi:hypothetical protein